MASEPHALSLAALPSVDRLLRNRASGALIQSFGRAAVTESLRAVLAEIRVSASPQAGSESAILWTAGDRLRKESQPSLRNVINLTGTVLHTNLGRSVLPEEAVDALVEAARGPVNLEFDLANGRRGDRDAHVERLICRLTGAEAATVVNNNAAAVLLVLNTLALRREVITSRGELIEIGGSFRMPEIMARAGCRLREVGTTNRTHLSDYQAAIGPRTALVMKVHPSNYTIEGFTAIVPEASLARLCREQEKTFVVDLGSGTLVDLRKFGLPHEPTPSETLAHGADLVTFSGDKLLGGPQAGIIAGRADLVRKIKHNPLRRALRVDKLTLAALSEVLRLYLHPNRLQDTLPVLQILTRDAENIRGSAERLRPVIADKLGDTASVEVIRCESQIGSGALPARTIPSAGLAIRPAAAGRSAGRKLEELAAAFRGLPVPVLGRIEKNTLVFDLRCLEDETGFTAQLGGLHVP